MFLSVREPLVGRSVEWGSHPSGILRGLFPGLLQVLVEPSHRMPEPLLPVPRLPASAQLMGQKTRLRTARTFVGHLP